VTGQQRFMTALRRQQPDRVPLWELIVDRPVIEALYGDISYLDFCEAEDLDAVTIFEDWRPTEQIDENTVRDEWGIVWRTASFGIGYAVGHPLENEADLADYEPPDPDTDYRLDGLQAAVERFKGQKAIVFLGHDAFEFSSYLRGMDKLLMDYIANPDLVHRLARIITDYKTRVLERAAQVGADVLLTGDDYAHRLAPMMSPDHFAEFVAPYLQECVDVAHQAGVPFIKHTDGNLWPIIDMLVETGIDCLIEPLASMDIGAVKEKYGHRIAVAGNVDCTELLCHGTPDDVVEGVKETIAKASPGGGHIMASSNSIHPAVRPENYRAMVQATRQFGQYPLDPDMVAEYRHKNYIAKYLDRPTTDHPIR